MKKTLSDFIRVVIVPIETNRLNHQKLYISIDGRSYGGFGEPIKYKPDIVEATDWGIENEIFPGKWRISKGSRNFKRGPFSRKLVLHSLHTILFSNTLAETLFQVEYEGEAETLRCDHLYSFGTASNSQNQEIPKYFEDTFNCLPAGLNAEKARILKPIMGWNYINNWQFALDCLTRALDEAAKDAILRGHNISNIYSKAVDYAKAENQWWFYKNDTDLQLLQEEYKNQVDFSSPMKSLRIQRLISADVENWVNKNYHLIHNHLGSAINKLVGGHRQWELASDVRSQIALFKRFRYEHEYDIPPFLDDSEVSKRISYAFMKEELDWQVQRLIELIGS